MALRSSSFAVESHGGARSDEKTKLLQQRHKAAMAKVLADAKSFSDDRRRALDEITDEALRQSAAR